MLVTSRWDGTRGIHFLVYNNSNRMSWAQCNITGPLFNTLYTILKHDEMQTISLDTEISTVLQQYEPIRKGRQYYNKLWIPVPSFIS